MFSNLEDHPILPGIVPDYVAMRETDRWVRTIRGPLAIVALAAFLEVLSQAGFAVPQVQFFLVLVVAYVAFVDGVAAGLLSAGISVLYVAYAMSPGESVFHAPVFQWEQLVVAGTAIPILALLVGLLRNQLEQAASREQAARERLSEVVEGLSAGFLILDGEKAPRYANERAVELLDLDRPTPDKVLQALRARLGPEAMGRLRRAATEARPEEIEVQDEGSERWFNVQVHPLSEGTAVYFADVTDRHRLQEQGQAVRRMQAIGQLSGGVAHDFNNLLTAIRGYNELAIQEMDPDDPNRENLEEVSRAADRAADLTRQLLAYSRQQILQPRILDLNRVVEEMRGMIRRLVREDIAFDVALGSDLQPVQVDAGQLERIVLNLVANASDAMPNGGRLSIATSRVSIEQPRDHGRFVVRAGEYSVLTVRDTGHGMDDRTKQQVFDPFFTTKDRGQGTGLGLSTVYGIVKQSDGYILVDTAPGEGTTFRVLLPAQEGAVEGEPERDFARTPGVPATGSATILLVEDDPGVRSLSARVLRQRGYTVLEAGNGAEALEIARRRLSPVDLLFTDIVMPGRSGREVARELKAMWPGIGILYTSGYTDDHILRGGIARGVLEPDIHFLHKPFTAVELADRVADILEALSDAGEPALTH